MITIGTDIVDVDRLRTMIERWEDKFLTRIFTGGEISYCRGQARPEEHFAARFAAKEAVKKALYAAGHREPIRFGRIEVLRSPLGIPSIHVEGLEQVAIGVSLSHTAHTALATALIESHDQRPYNR